MELGPSDSTTDPSPPPRRDRPPGRHARAGRAAGVALATALGLLLPAAPAGAGEGPGDPGDPAEPAPTVLVLEAGSARAGQDVTLRVSLTGEDGTPVAAAPVALERRVGDDWSLATSVTTDAAGGATAAVPMRRRAEDNVFRARYDGDGASWAPSASGAVSARLVRRHSRVRLHAPRRVVDGRRARLRVRLTTGNGTPVRARVELQTRRDGRWRTVRRARTDDRGRARVSVRPHRDSRWRAVFRKRDWIRADRSPVRRIRLLPPGDPVRLPAAAPRPRVQLPPQRHALGRGPNPRITRIPDDVWRSMTGRSWHRGCPVGRAGLRLLRINYWGYDGFRHRGEVVAAAGAIGQMSAALAEMHRRRLPIRSMYRVDRFGWSSRLQGADDYRSMAAGNTSAFNCRWVVGRPGVRSPHAYGRALDVNTWENPYRSSHGWTPNSWWAARSHPRVAWRSRSHPVVALMLRHGFRWTYGTSDSQHFDAVGGGGRVIVPRGCADAASCK